MHRIVTLITAKITLNIEMPIVSIFTSMVMAPLRCSVCCIQKVDSGSYWYLVWNKWWSLMHVYCSTLVVSKYNCIVLYVHMFTYVWGSPASIGSQTNCFAPIFTFSGSTCWWMHCTWHAQLGRYISANVMLSWCSDITNDIMACTCSGSCDLLV